MKREPDLPWFVGTRLITTRQVMILNRQARGSGRGWLMATRSAPPCNESRNQSLALGLRHENHLTELNGPQDIPIKVGRTSAWI